MLVPKGKKITQELLKEITGNIIHLRELRKKQDKLLGDLEYVIYLKYLWRSRDPDDDFEDNTSYYPRVRFQGGSHTRGWICVVRHSDKVEIRFPVVIEYQHYAGVMDMYDSGELPERFIELVFQHLGGKQQGYPDLTTVTNYVRRRDQRLAKNEKFKERHGHYPKTLGGVLVAPLRVTTSGDEIQLDDFPRNDGPPEVVSSEGKEGSESQAG